MNTEKFNFDSNIILHNKLWDYYCGLVLSDLLDEHRDKKTPKELLMFNHFNKTILSELKKEIILMAQKDYNLAEDKLVGFWEDCDKHYYYKVRNIENLQDYVETLKGKCDGQLIIYASAFITRFCFNCNKLTRLIPKIKMSKELRARFHEDDHEYNYLYYCPKCGSGIVYNLPKEFKKAYEF